MPRYRSDGSVTFVEKRRKDGKARGVMYRKPTNNTYSIDLSLQRVQMADLQMEQEKNNSLDLK